MKDLKLGGGGLQTPIPPFHYLCKQLLSSMIVHEAAQVPYTTRIAFLTDSIKFSSTSQPFFGLLLYCSYIAIYEGSTFKKNSKLLSI